MDPNRQEFIATMRADAVSLQGPPPHRWHSGEAQPRPFLPYPIGNDAYFLKQDGRPRVRDPSNRPVSPPTPVYVPPHPSHPPGFDVGHRKSSGFDNGHGFQGGVNYQESLEITSDRPFLPPRRDLSSVVWNVPMSSDQVLRAHNQGASDGVSSELTMPSKKSRKRKKSKFSSSVSNVGIPASADPIMSSTSLENARAPSNPPSVLSEPPRPRPAEAPVQKPAAYTFDRATKECQKSWENFSLAIRRRERFLKEREQSLDQSTKNREALEEEMREAAAKECALEEEKKEVAAMKNEIIEERRKLEEEAQRIREEKVAMERTSTEIALQMVELKQVQKQIDKEKAAILALKRGLQEQDCVEGAGTAPFVAVKAEIEDPVRNPRRNFGNSCTHDSDAGPTDIRNRDVSSVSKLSPMPSNRNFEPVKVELMTSGSGAAHGDKSRLHDNSSEDDMDDVPLAHRLKSQRVAKTGEKRKLRTKAMRKEDLNVESSRKKASAYRKECYLKRNQVPIEVALQEDAPGLLEQLEEKGVLEDVGIYQDLGSDDSLAEESPASEFRQLEGIIGKLWGASAGLAKDLVPLKGQMQGSSNMPRYCLACLLSLIEQTRLLRKRNWPVEWGWCRRLRAFLFVFEKHNRIVLERPEYGFATYSFELVQGLPVKWQVQRLITVMSVASNGRAALLENRQLVVGTDLSDEEAAVLEDYGWNRSSGLGSLLNFCDRVVHDYNKGQDPAELGNDWKQKIGKLLMDGYDQGSILATSIPRRLKMVLGNNLSDVEPRLEVKAKDEPHWTQNNVQ